MVSRNLLLQAGGVNPDEALRKLDLIEAQPYYDHSAAPVDTDLDVGYLHYFSTALPLTTVSQSYLNSRKEQNIMSSIEEGIQRISRDFDAYVAKNVTMEWDKQKERIFEHFGLVPKSETDSNRLDPNTFGASTFGRSVRAGPGAQGNVYGTGSVWAQTATASVYGRATQAGLKAFTDVDHSRQLSMSRPVQLRQQNYAIVVRQLNEARLSGSPFPILNKFQEVTAGSGSDVVSVECYEIE